MKFIILLFILFIPMGLFAQSEYPIDLSIAHRYFMEAQEIARNDGGRTWGISLEGPILFVDPQTRFVTANHGDAERRLVRRGTVFTGILPPEVNIANTVVEWSGTKWAMIIWPPPREPHIRRVLLLHELWHRIQTEIGFPLTNPSNHHLDTKDGRIWLRYEFLALENALTHTGERQRQFIRDALLFRTYRHSLFPQARDEERQLEMHEGLAEYSGVRLGITSEDERIIYVRRRLSEIVNADSYVRSFAYATGPAYGVLLDQRRVTWYRLITATSDLTELVLQYYGINLPVSIERDVRSRAALYEDGNIAMAEDERMREVLKQQERFLQSLVNGPVLIIPVVDMNISFNPTKVFPLEGHGNVYETLRVTDNWGILDVSGIGLVNSRWSAIHVPAPEQITKNMLKGPGYTIDLRDGWEIVPGSREGDFIIQKNE